MHIVGLVDSPDHVCCRYRLRAFGDELSRGGHILECRPLPKTWFGRALIGIDLSGVDIVVLQRRLLPGWQRRLLRRSVRRLIFDFDDAVFGRDSYAAAGFDSARRRRRFAATMRICDAVVAGNNWLAQQARAAGARAAVSVIPTCVEPAVYPHANHAAHDGAVRLTWIGSSSTLRGLSRLGWVLAAVGKSIPNARLRLICDRFLQVEGLPIETCRWDPATEALALAGGDIGISWSPDDSWSRGKCGLKILQYMAAGLPVVANPVGVQAEFVQHGVTGFHARTPEEWLAAIARLAENRELRQRMGAAGRARVEREFSVAVGGQLWRNLVDQMMQSGRAA